MTNELIIVLVTSVFTIGGIVIALYLNSKLNRTANYDLERRHAELDDIRHSLEKQMYVINDRLIQTEERWKDVNHLLLNKNADNYSAVTGHRSHSSRPTLTSFLESNGIRQNDLENVNPRFVFVLTPFHERWFEEFSVIRETCDGMGFICKRGDEHSFKGDIFPEMLKMIVNAGIIIANVNGRNANVMYELGIAHALDKKVILISENPEKLPIDVQSKNFVIYSSYQELHTRLQEELRKLL